jgi:cation transport protein ChaC
LPENEDAEWPVIWNREMNTGVYNAIWADLTLQSGEVVKALTFVVDPTHSQYAGGMPIPVMSEVIAGATGEYGRCRDYLASTVEEMAKLGVVDEYLNSLLTAVDAQMESNAD